MKDQGLKGLNPTLLRMVWAESERQIEKWGIQDRDPSEWMLFLTEEVGELAEAVAEHKYRDGGIAHVVEEATQVSTLALKILEMYLFMESD